MPWRLRLALIVLPVVMLFALPLVIHNIRVAYQVENAPSRTARVTRREIFNARNPSANGPRTYEQRRVYWVEPDGSRGWDVLEPDAWGRVTVKSPIEVVTVNGVVHARGSVHGNFLFELAMLGLVLLIVASGAIYWFFTYKRWRARSGRVAAAGAPPTVPPPLTRR